MAVFLKNPVLLQPQFVSLLSSTCGFHVCLEPSLIEESLRTEIGLIRTDESWLNILLTSCAFMMSSLNFQAPVPALGKMAERHPDSPCMSRHKSTNLPVRRHPQYAQHYGIYIYIYYLASEDDTVKP